MNQLKPNLLSAVGVLVDVAAAKFVGYKKKEEEKFDTKTTKLPLFYTKKDIYNSIAHSLVFHSVPNKKFRKRRESFCQLQ